MEVARSVNRDLAPVLPSRLDGDPRLDALRSLLLEHDRAALAALQRKMDDPQQFAEAISAVLARAFTLAETREELAAVLAPMERAARMAIRKDPSTLVGVMHPLVGPAIRRSIAETLDGTLQGLNQAFKAQLVVARAEVATRGVPQRQHLRGGGAQAHGRVPRRAPFPHPRQDRAAA